MFQNRIILQGLETMCTLTQLRNVTKNTDSAFRKACIWIQLCHLQGPGITLVFLSVKQGYWYLSQKIFVRMNCYLENKYYFYASTVYRRQRKNWLLLLKCCFHSFFNQHQGLLRRTGGWKYMGVDGQGGNFGGTYIKKAVSKVL